MADEVIALLWADDDIRGALEPFGRRVKRNNFTIADAVDYCEAVEKLKYGSFDALLLDIILPFAQGTGALEDDLGLKFADEAPDISSSVRNIAFLTVVQRQEVNEKYESICQKHKERVRFKYFDKTKLLEPNYITLLLQFLRNK